MRRGMELGFVLAGLALSGCLALPIDSATDMDPGSRSMAAQAAEAYFGHLSRGEYERAASLYGGSLEDLKYNNPEVDPDDLAALFESACRLQLRCLPVQRIVGYQELSPGEFVLQVEFQGPDGETFVLGPCCGASEEVMPPQSVFEVRVGRTAAGSFEVLDLPVYVP